VTRTLRAAGATDIGRRRQNNEDRFHVDSARGVFMVVDGVGGHAAGETAADTAVATMLERLARQTGPATDRVREAITIANNEIHRLASTRPDWRGMACVLTVAVLDEDRVVVGHVGDSRLYLIRGDQVDKVTPDHSPVGEREDANELSESEAMRHPRRNEVYRDVGSEMHAVSDPDFAFVRSLELPPDAAILICSDGLTDLVPSDTIRDIALTHTGGPDGVVKALIAAANDAGGKDNVTAVFVEGETFAPRAVGSRMGTDVRTDQAKRRWMMALAMSFSALVGGAIGNGLPRDFWTGRASTDLLTAPISPATVVRAGESISSALATAAAGAEVIVEPGEYRERLTLKDHVRVVSRVPRGAILRLPADATEADAAVTAHNVEHAELTGFRIVGDAATPLGTGVVVGQGSSVRLTDLEITGASIAAVEIGAGDVVLLAAEIHDNPGAGIVVKSGATPRVTQNTFGRNGLSPRALSAVSVESDAAPTWWHNVFLDLRAENIPAANDEARKAIARDNWFVGPKNVATRPASPPRGGRAR
jgi:PPM family protein phosphatase